MSIKKISIPKFGGPEVLELVEVPTPKLNDKDVLVKASVIGVGWPDVYVRTGTYPWQHLFPLPATPGIEMSGTVAAIGSGVKKFKVGQPVYVSSRLLGFRGGCYSEAMAVPEDSLFALPDNLSMEIAAGLAYYQLAIALLQECTRGLRGDWVVIHGASGGVGTALVQTAKACGYHVIATVGHDSKRVHASAAGADAVFNYRSEDIKAKIAQVTGGHGVNFWFESYAGPTMGDVFDHMALWGKIVLYNAIGGHPPATFFDDWRRQIRKSVSLQYFSMHVYEDDHGGLRNLFERAIQFILAGKINPMPGTIFSLSDAAKAHRLLESGSNTGRIFLRP